MKEKVKGMKRKIKDDDGNEIGDKDVVHFSYGLPPIGVNAKVV